MKNAIEGAIIMENQNTKLQYLKRQMESAVDESRYEEVENLFVKAKVLSTESSELENIEKLYNSIKPILEEKRQNKKEIADEENIEREHLELRNKDSNKMALLAAVSFLICALPGLIQQFTVSFSIISLLLGTLPTILVAVSLFRMKKDAITTIAFSLRMLATLYWLIAYFSINNLLSAIAMIVTLAIVFVSCSLYSSKKNKELCKKLWFLPLALVAIDNIVFIAQIFPYLAMNIGTVVSTIAEIAAFAFIGLWIKE